MPPFTRFHAACATVLLSAGCYGPMYSSPYGYPTYPGQPGSPYYPGTTVAPGGTMLGPGTPTFDSSGGASSGGNAPPYNGSSSSGTGGSTDTSNRPVPNYADPTSGNSPYFKEPNNANGQAGATPRERFGSRSSDLEPNPATGGNNNSPATLDFDSSGAADQFQKPIEGTLNKIPLSGEVPSSADRRYGYDPDGHDWLQGIVSFDPRDRNWSIVYSLNPDPADPYAGYLTLAQDPRFAVLKDGDVVRVEGEVDPVARDQTGRAVYLVSQISPVGR